MNSPSTPEPAAVVDQNRWFTEEVQPHAPSLKAYLRGSFPTVRDVEDLVQESCLRIWKARATRPILSARAFLFGIGRRLAIDQIRRRHPPAHEAVTDFHSLRVLDGAPDVAETASARQEIALLGRAIDALPARCREIIILRKLEGLSHQEIAARLGISTNTVEVQVRRGMEKCTHFLVHRGVGPRDARGD